MIILINNSPHRQMITSQNTQTGIFVEIDLEEIEKEIEIERRNREKVKRIETAHSQTHVIRQVSKYLIKYIVFPFLLLMIIPR